MSVPRTLTVLSRALAVAALLVACALPGRFATASPLDTLLRRHPADSLAGPLRRFENATPSPREGARAAATLGHLFYARGEYRRAADAFTRAAARLEPAAKPETRYWAGLSWLALGESGRARAILEEVVEVESPRAIDARLALAIAWEDAREPERALGILEPIARRAGASEAIPAVLEHTIALADRLHRRDLAALARERLLRDYPRSMEAAKVSRAGVAASGAAVELGPFPSEPRAHAVADQARRAGFASARPATRGEGSRRTYLVRLGEFESDAEAQQAAERARRELGVPVRVVSR